MEVDFSAPKTYTVTAEDGTTQDYLVTVVVPLGAETKDITSFALKAKDGTSAGSATGSISETIAIESPWGTDVKWLVPSIGISGVSVSPKGEVAQDFSEPVRYTVTAENGSTKEYLVTVTVASGASAKDITSFGLKTKDATEVGNNTTSLTRTEIGEDTITVLVPAGTDVEWLVPDIGISALASVSPATAVAQNFSVPVRYTVTAQDDSTKEYLVTVTEASLKSLGIAGPTKASYKVGEALDLAGFSVTATYSDNVTETVADYELSVFENDTVGTKTITVTVTRDEVTLKKDFTVSVTGEALALKIELVNDEIVKLFGLTTAEVSNTTTGIPLSVRGSRREVVVSLTGYSNKGTTPSDVKWRIDGGGTWANAEESGNVVTIKASNYTLGRHWVEFTGTTDPAIIIWPKRIKCSIIKVWKE
jgi:hypothetical protein